MAELARPVHDALVDAHISTRRTVVRGCTKMELMAGRAFGLMVCPLLWGCGFLWKQVEITTESECIEHECHGEHGKARQQCMTACQREYGP